MTDDLVKRVLEVLQDRPPSEAVVTLTDVLAFVIVDYANDPLDVAEDVHHELVQRISRYVNGQAGEGLGSQEG